MLASTRYSGDPKFHRGALYLEASGWMTEANAQLLAAAPELLEALQGLLSFAEEVEQKMLVGDEGCLWPVEAARAAIAKATARTEGEG